MPVAPPAPAPAPAPGPGPRSLLVADSFRVRVRDGVTEVRGFALHLARFKASALAAARDDISASQVDQFLETARTRIADAFERVPPPSYLLSDGRVPASIGGFPRLELWGATLPPDTPATPDTAATPNVTNKHEYELSLALRSLPEIRSSIDMTCAEVPENVTHPGRKGPNIVIYSSLTQGGGGEALLVRERAGIERTGKEHPNRSERELLDLEVIEGTTTSLVWWSLDGQGFTVASQERVPSVTEALVSGIARDLTAPLQSASITARELLVHEVWAVNALHGIRPVLAINGVSLPRALTPAANSRFGEFRFALDQTWEPVRSRAH